MQLYKQYVKGHWQTLNNLPYQSQSIVVELNLTRSDKEPAQRLSEVRNGFEESLSCLNFTSKLWSLFKLLISRALNEVISLQIQDKTCLMD